MRLQNIALDLIVGPGPFENLGRSGFIILAVLLVAIAVTTGVLRDRRNRRK